MIDEVLEFIQRRFPKDSNWCDGNCYWFARILNERFPQFKIFLFPIENHFVVGDGEIFYDWNGKHSMKDFDEFPILWEKVKEWDSSYYNRIMRDCIM